MTPLGEELQAFLIMVAVGTVMGTVFDLYRATLLLFRPPRWATHAGDLGAWIFMTGLVFFLLLLGNWGEFRSYVLLGLLLGLGLYLRWFSPRIIRFWFGFFLWVGRIVGFFWRMLLFPFKLLGRIVIIPLGILGTILHWVMRPVVWLWRTIKRYVRRLREGVIRALRLWIRPRPPRDGSPPAGE